MMETTFRLRRHGYTVEEFEHALYCGGVISPWRERIRTVHTGSRCGGAHHIRPRQQLCPHLRRGTGVLGTAPGDGAGHPR